MVHEGLLVLVRKKVAKCVCGGYHATICVSSCPVAKIVCVCMSECTTSSIAARSPNLLLICCVLPESLFPFVSQGLI